MCAFLASLLASVTHRGIPWLLRLRPQNQLFIALFIHPEFTLPEQSESLLQEWEEVRKRSVTFMKVILALDAGPTNVKAILVDHQANVLARSSVPLTIDFPKSGGVEQSAKEVPPARCSGY